MVDTAGLQGTTASLGDDVSVQSEEEKEPFWKDGGEDTEETVKGEQVEEDMHKVGCKC